MKTIQVTIDRNSGEPAIYSVTVTSDMMVIDLLHQIQTNIDSTLQFRRSCESGICGSCAMQINGRNSLACSYTLSKTKKLHLAPLQGFPRLTDLVVDMSPFFDTLRKIPFSEIIKTKQSMEERAKLDGFYECIHCGTCSSSCQVYQKGELFLGPAHMMMLWSEIVDSRKNDTKELLHLAEKSGIWECQLFLECMNTCAKGLNPTEAIINIRNKV